MRQKQRNIKLVELRNVILEDFAKSYSNSTIDFYERMQKLHPNLDNFLRDLVDCSIDTFVDFYKGRIEERKLKIFSEIMKNQKTRRRR